MSKPEVTISKSGHPILPIGPLISKTFDVKTDKKPTEEKKPTNKTDQLLNNQKIINDNLNEGNIITWQGLAGLGDSNKQILVRTDEIMNLVSDIWKHTQGCSCKSEIEALSAKIDQLARNQSSGGGGSSQPTFKIPEGGWPGPFSKKP